MGAIWEPPASPRALSTYERLSYLQRRRLVCEVHRFVPWQGGTMECCAGPAAPCDCNPRGRMPPGFKVHCSVNDEEEAEQKAVLNLELPAALSDQPQLFVAHR